jgi:hypothetical protein
VNNTVSYQSISLPVAKYKKLSSHTHSTEVKYHNIIRHNHIKTAITGVTIISQIKLHKFLAQNHLVFSDQSIAILKVNTKLDTITFTKRVTNAINNQNNFIKIVYNITI